jgi:prolyl-tRNA synthetase
LGHNCAKASEIKFQSSMEKEEYAWTTSWGASTRLIGGLIMTHGDDDGIILPPRVASAHVVLMPIIRDPEDKMTVMTYVEHLAKELKDKCYHHRRLEVEIDDREIGGARGWEWIKKGIPVRVEIGPRDIADNSVYVGRRDKGHTERRSIKRERFVGEITQILDDIQQTLFDRALLFRKTHSITLDDKTNFYEFFTPENPEQPEIHGGFAWSHWCGEERCEAKIKEDLSVTIRCIPLAGPSEKGKCICCGQPSSVRVVFAKAY